MRLSEMADGAVSRTTDAAELSAQAAERTTQPTSRRSLSPLRRSLSPQRGTDTLVVGLASSVLLLFGHLSEHDPSQVQPSDIELAVAATAALAETMSSSYPRISLQLRL